MTNGLHDNVMLQLVKKLLYTFLTECSADTRPKLFKLHYTPLHNIQDSSFFYIYNYFKSVNTYITLRDFRYFVE